MLTKKINTNSILNTISIIGAFSVSAVGLTVILAWYFNWPKLIQLHPSFVPMQHNTALCFLLSALAILSAVKLKKISLIFTSLVGLISSLTLVEYIFDINIGIDELFVKHDITVQTSHPGRMAPNTALSFLFISCSIFLINLFTNKYFLALVSASVVFCLGFVSIVGYLVEIELAYGWGRLTRMAVHTASSFIILSICINIRFFKEIFGKRIYWLYLLSGFFGTLFILFTWFLSTRALKNSTQETSQSLILFASLVILLLIVAYFDSFFKQKAAYLRLDKSLNDLKKKTEELDDFVKIIAHDLKSPLNNISQLIDWVKEDNVENFNKETHKNFDLIKSRVLKMNNLIQSLLRYARAGNEKRELSSINSDELFLSVEGLVEGNKKSKVLKEGEFLSFKTYIEPLKTCLRNLISNAIKHNNQELAEVKISFSENNNFIFIAVSDNGPGIKSEDQEKIFKLFQTLNDKSSTSGMGLALIKKTLNNYGGSIKVNSNLPTGATFTISWPKSKEL